MKIDRMLGIVMTLLERDTVSARELADKYEVSVRTIGRDIDAIGMAGIPVGSVYGASGGYFLMESFKRNRHYLADDDYRIILAALKGLNSGYENGRAEAALAKLRAWAPAVAREEAAVQLDLGAAAEGDAVRSAMSMLETEIRRKTAVQFAYVDASNRSTEREVEPVLLTYRWYAWYLLGFCRNKQDYRLFRLSRKRGSLSRRQVSLRWSSPCRSRSGAGLPLCCRLAPISR